MGVFLGPVVSFKTVVNDVDDDMAGGMTWLAVLVGAGDEVLGQVLGICMVSLCLILCVYIPILSLSSSPYVHTVVYVCICLPVFYFL
jgi:hypothetical protein